MDPINYILDVKNPLDEYMKGLKFARTDLADQQVLQMNQQNMSMAQQNFADQQRALQEQRSAAAQQQAEALKLQSDLGEIAQLAIAGNLPASKLLDFQAKHVKTFEDANAIFAAKSQEQQASQRKFSVDLAMSLFGPKPEFGTQMLEQRIAAVGPDSEEAKPLEVLLQVAKTNPKYAATSVLTTGVATGIIPNDLMTSIIEATQTGQKPTEAMRTLDGQLRAAGIVPKNEGGDGRYEAAQAKAAGAGNGEEPDLFELERKTRDEYTQLTKDFRTVNQSFNRLDAAENTGAGDIALIFNYMKMLDPGSVVREGEFATAQNSAGIPTAIVNMYNQAINGTRLTDQQRLDFKSQASGLLKAAEKSKTDAISSLMPVVKQYGLDPARVFGTSETITGTNTETPTTPPAPIVGGANSSLDFSAMTKADLLAVDVMSLTSEQKAAMLKRFSEVNAGP